MSGSPKTFVQAMLYGEKGLPEESVPHLLAADNTVRGELQQLLGTRIPVLLAADGSNSQFGVNLVHLT